MRRELWYIGLARAHHSAQRAVYLEDHGWDGLMFPDTQCIANDAYIEMAMCVASTRRLHFSTGVTNPVTRDSSVVASAVSTLQEESGGRMSLAIGRGDSAAAYIGKEGASLKEMRRFLTELQAYLSGDSVDREGRESRLLWLKERGIAKVPVDIAGTGPKMIEMAALLGDGICLAVGGDPGRIASKVQQVEEILDRVGRPREDFTISLLMTGTVNHDLELARDNIRGVTGTVIRFSGMSAAAAADLPAATARRAIPGRGPSGGRPRRPPGTPVPAGTSAPRRRDARGPRPARRRRPTADRGGRRRGPGAFRRRTSHSHPGVGPAAAADGGRGVPAEGPRAIPRVRRSDDRPSLPPGS